MWSKEQAKGQVISKHQHQDKIQNNNKKKGAEQSKKNRIAIHRNQGLASSGKDTLNFTLQSECRNGVRIYCVVVIVFRCAVFLLGLLQGRGPGLSRCLI